MENQPDNVTKLVHAGSVESVLDTMFGLADEYEGVIVIGVRKDKALTLHGTKMTCHERAYLCAFFQEYINSHFRRMDTMDEPA